MTTRKVGKGTAALVQQVMDQIEDVDITSAPIHKYGVHTIYGLAVAGGDQVWVDENSTLICTLVHELIHTLRGRASEERVATLSRRVINARTAAQFAELAGRYHAIKRRERVPVRADD
jgi:hypothetical protein